MASGRDFAHIVAFGANRLRCRDDSDRDYPVAAPAERPGSPSPALSFAAPRVREPQRDAVRRAQLVEDTADDDRERYGHARTTARTITTTITAAPEPASTSLQCAAEHDRVRPSRPGREAAATARERKSELHGKGPPFRRPHSAATGEP